MKKISGLFSLMIALTLMFSSCAKKDDATTSTSTTTGTTGNNTNQTILLNHILVDSSMSPQLGCNWDPGQGGQYDLIAGVQTPEVTIGLGGIFSPEPTTSRTLNITISVPNPDPGAVHLYYTLNDTVEFVAQGGTADLKVVHFFAPLKDSLYLTFNKINFKRLGSGTRVISGYLGFQGKP